MRFARSILAAVTVVVLSAVTMLGIIPSFASTAGTQYFVQQDPVARQRIVPTSVVKPVRDSIRAAVNRVYVVKPNDYLSMIAQHVYGQARYWTGIYDTNRKLIANPDLIYAGQRFTIPSKPYTVTVSLPAAPPAPVVTGDSDSDGGSVGSHSGSNTGSNLVSSAPVSTSSGCSDPSGQLTYAQVGMLWLCAGGPAWAEGAAENVSWCESGHNTGAYNPSGATGLWQILGQVVFTGSLYDAHVNAENAVSKFKASGDTWAQWVCQP